MALYKNTKLRLLEQAKGLQASEVCEELGINPVTYAAVKNGKLIPSKRIQNLLANFYEVPFETLIQEINEEIVVSAIKLNYMG